MAGWAQNDMLICEDDLRGADIAALLQTHLDTMALHSPPESIHALDLDALRVPEITFWTAREDNRLLGCGALKELDSGHGEIKSMHTAQPYRGRGVARRLLEHILDEAAARSYTRLSLETGSMDAFAPARALYAGYGFAVTGPFGNYVDDPFSIFMTLDLTAG
jgi:putative acetyltransferase